MSTFRQFLEKDQPDILSRIDEDILFEMANVSPKASGTGVRLYFSWGEHAGKTLPHGPRFKIVIKSGQLVTVALDHMQCPRGLDAKAWRRVIQFVELNKDTIMKFWNKQLEDPEFHASLIPV